jgi:hypothetical protein
MPRTRIVGPILAALACALLLAPAAGAASAPPTCADNGYTVQVGQSVAVQEQCDDDGPLTYSIDVWPTEGSIVGDTSTGIGTYTPRLDSGGLTDTYVYRATDGDGQTATAEVTITITPAPSQGLPPVCPNPLNVFVPVDGSTIVQGSCADPEEGPVSYAPAPQTIDPRIGLIPPDKISFTPNGDMSPGTFLYTATDSLGNQATPQPVVSFTVIPAGETEVSTGTTPTPTDQFVAAVETDDPGAVQIGERTTSDPPPVGYFFVGREFDIVAAPQTAANPLRLTFTFDASAVPQGTELFMFRNGALVDQPCPTPGQALPDGGPCVESSGPVSPGDPESDVRIVIITASS